MVGHFLTTRLMQDRLTDLGVDGRSAYHLVMNGLHGAVHRGREDVAVVLATWATRLCQQVRQEGRSR